MEELFNILIMQEKLLHQPKTRCDGGVLNALLHDEFFEFCRSGMTTNKESTVHALSGQLDNVLILSENYSCHLIDQKAVLMTYVSYQIEDGIKMKLTNRSSLWVETAGNQWQLRFHQGTPVTEPCT